VYVMRYKRICIFVLSTKALYLEGVNWEGNYVRYFRMTDKYDSLTCLLEERVSAVDINVCRELVK